MRDGPISAKIAIPPVRLRLKSRCTNAGIEHVQPLLALTATDNFTDPGRQHVHRSDGLSVIIDAHIKRLNLFWIVHKHYWPSDDFLTNISLMFGLQVHPPAHWVFKFSRRIAKPRDGLRVCHAFEARVQQVLYPAETLGIDLFHKELEVVGALCENTN